MMNTQEQANNEETLLTRSISYLILVCILIWFLIGIIGFLLSLVCFGRSGTIIQKLGGFGIALLTGPFFWVYYFLDTSYCRVS